MYLKAFIDSELDKRMESSLGVHKDKYQMPDPVNYAGIIKRSSSSFERLHPYSSSKLQHRKLRDVTKNYQPDHT